MGVLDQPTSIARGSLLAAMAAAAVLGSVPRLQSAGVGRERASRSERAVAGQARVCSLCPPSSPFLGADGSGSALPGRWVWGEAGRWKEHFSP